MNTFEKVDISVKVAIAIFTALTSYIAFQWNQRLDERKFSQEQIDHVYDRFVSYLSVAQSGDSKSASQCKLVAVYVKHVANPEIAADLQQILDGSRSFCVAQAVAEVAVEAKAPIKPAGIDDYRKSFVFSRNSDENSDVTVYVCENANDLEKTVALAGRIGAVISASKSFGQVKGSFWRSYDGVVPQLQKVTFVIDKPKYAEDRKVTEILALLAKASIPAESVSLDNPGAPTPWRTSVIVCE